jgi:hypothetical protein
VFVAIGVGCIFAVSGAITLAYKIHFVRQAMPISGVIVDRESIHEGIQVAPGSGLIPIPVTVHWIECKLPNGADLIARLPSRHRKDYAVGQRVEVMYHEHDPHSVEMVTQAFWYLPSVLLLLGLISIVTGIFVR